MVALLCVSVGLMLLAVIIKVLRARMRNSMTRSLSGSWSYASFWFGFTGLILVVSRGENILFLQMRILWIVWVLCMAVYIFFQVLSFRNRHYAVIKHPHRGQDHDPYLPRKKK
jgi:Ca2+/Na+ antiporter